MKYKLNKPKIVIVTSPNDWHWAISLEYLWHQIQRGTEIGILDLSYVGEIGLRSYAKELFDKKSLRVSALRFIDSQGISVYRSKSLRLGKSRHQNFANT